MGFKFDPLAGRFTYIPPSNLENISVNNLPTTNQPEGTQAYCLDATGFGKFGSNSQSVIYSKGSSWYRTDTNTEVVPNPRSIWEVGSTYNTYNPNLSSFNETIINSSTSGGIYTQNSFIDMPINGQLIRIYVKYQIKSSLRGTGNNACIIFSNGWGASVDDFTTYINNDYAVVQYDWRGTFNGTYSYPTTLMTLYPPALSALNQVTNPNANYAKQVSVNSISDIRNQDFYYWYAMPRRVLAYAKSLSADISSSKIGFWGHSWGGQIAYNMAIESDIKASVAAFGNGWIHYWKTFGVLPYSIPYAEPTFSEANNYYISTLESQSYAKYMKAPLLWMTSTNDFHGQFDNGFKNFEISPVSGSYAFKVNANHDYSGMEQNIKLWFDKYLKGSAITWPTNPNTIPSLTLTGPNSGYPMVTVSPSNVASISSVQIYYALETANPMNRTWLPAITVNNGNGTWSAQTSCYNTNGYVFAYAQIAYNNTVIVCSKQAAFIPNTLGNAVPLPVNYWKPTDATSGTVNLWLDAADSNTISLSGTYVTEWRDKSSVANNAISQYGEEPVFTNVDGLNAIRFTGSKRLFSTNKFTARDFRNVFIVAKYELQNVFYSATGYVALFEAAVTGGSSNGNCFFANSVSQAFTGTSFLGGAFYLNGTQISPDTNGRTVLPQLNTALGIISSSSSSAVSVGGYALGSLREISSPWDGVICEVVSYGSTLTTTERQKIEGYLAWKWNIVSLLPSDHPYKSTRPVI